MSLSPSSEVRWNDGKGTVYEMAFDDFNGDGWPDIVAARSDAPDAIWFSTVPRTSRLGQLAPAHPFTTPASAGSGVPRPAPSR
ncbi:MAG: VCBS repeat-containing protein [Acidobacteriota bacterium]